MATAVSTSPVSGLAVEWPAAELAVARRWSRLELGRVVFDLSFIISNGLMIGAALVMSSRLELAVVASFYVACAVFLPMSSVVHEAGHGLVALALGYRVNFVRFSWSSCAVDWSRSDGLARPRDVMWVALAGPGANLGSACVALALLQTMGPSAWLSAIAVVSLLQAAGNLVPRRTGSEPHPATNGGLPTDGYVFVWALRCQRTARAA